MTFGQNLTMIRKRKGISQESLAYSVGISRQTMYTYEADIASPNVDVLKRLTQILEVSVEDLIVGFDVDKLPKKLEPYALTETGKYVGEIIFRELPNWFITLKKGNVANWGIYDDGVKDYSYHLEVLNEIKIHEEVGFEVLIDAYDKLGNKDLDNCFILVAQEKDNHLCYLAKKAMVDNKIELLTYKDKKFLKEWGDGLSNLGRKIIYSDPIKYLLQYGNKKYSLFLLSFIEGDNYFEHYVDEEGNTFLWKRYDKNRKSDDIKMINQISYGHFYDCVTDRLR